MWFLQWDNDGTIHIISKKEQNNLKLFCLEKKNNSFYDEFD